MVVKIKNVFSKAALPSLAMVLALCLNSAHGMEKEIDSFSDEVLTLSLKPLPIKDLGRCAQVCHQWNNVSSDDPVWREKAQQYGLAGGKFKVFPIKIGDTETFPSWKQILKDNHPSWIELKNNPPAKYTVGQGGLFIPNLNLNLNLGLSFLSIDGQKKNGNRVENITGLYKDGSYGHKTQGRKLLQKMQDKKDITSEDWKVFHPGWHAMASAFKK